MDDRTGNACQLRHMHAVAFISTTGNDFAQEDDFAFLLGDGYIHALDAGEHLGGFDQFMVVGGEEGECATTFVIVEILDNGTGNGQAVIGTGTTANFVKDDEAARCGMVQDVGGLDHLDHKGALASGEVVLGTDTGEDAIDKANGGNLSGDIASDLGHQDDERNLAQIGGFTRHVGASDNHDLRVGSGELGIVWNKWGFRL